MACAHSHEGLDHPHTGVGGGVRQWLRASLCEWSKAVAACLPLCLVARPGTKEGMGLAVLACCALLRTRDCALLCAREAGRARAADGRMDGETLGTVECPHARRCSGRGDAGAARSHHPCDPSLVGACMHTHEGYRRVCRGLHEGTEGTLEILEIRESAGGSA